MASRRSGYAAANSASGFGQHSPLRAGHLAQTVHGLGTKELLDKALAAENDLMAKPLPDARLSDSIDDEGCVARLRLSSLFAELAQEPIRLQPFWCRCRSDHRAVTAPWPIARPRHHSRPERVEYDVPREFQ